MPTFITENHNALVTAMLESAQAPLRKRITELEERVQELESSLRPFVSEVTYGHAMKWSDAMKHARSVLDKKAGAM